jgi:hypothetical protein
MRAIIGLIFAVFAPIALLGCATEAQRRATTMRSEIIAAAKEAKSCILALNAKPEYGPLWVHTPIPPAEPTIDQLADGTYPSTSEIALIKMRHDEVAPCQQRVMDRLESVDGRIAAAFFDEFNERDQVTLDLMQHKKTWGQANQAAQVLKAAAKRKLILAAREIDGQLRDQNEAEIEQRREVAQRIAQGFAAAVQVAATVAEAAEVARETRQASRPVVTTCNQTLFNTTCVSQ